MGSVDQFQGWVAHDPSAAEGKMQWGSFQPKVFNENEDVEMDITHSGVCGTDLHTLRSGWGPSDYPLVVGHEIIGKVTRVGKGVKDVKIGDRVGVGAMSRSCLECKYCEADEDNHCPKATSTYNSKYPDGSKAMGGHAKQWRGPASHAFKIPDGLPSEVAAPLMCGGVTVYNPLVENGAGPGKRVGVIGVGGLGHFAVCFAKALKCDKVVAISRSSSKKEDALKMGADEYIATGESDDWMNKNAGSLDLIISTISGKGFKMDQYLKLLDVKGTLIQVGAPEDPIPAFPAFSLIFQGVKFGGSLIGSRKRIIEMLEFAAKTDFTGWIQVRPMEEANQVLIDFEAGKPRYRYVLKN